MTVQRNVELVWASSGGTTDPGGTKYIAGWVSEIPTYQNFNYVLQDHSKNILVLAEQGAYQWQDDINYHVGGWTMLDGIIRYATSANVNNNPNTSSNWSYTPNYGEEQDNTSDIRGLVLTNVNDRNASTWDGNDVTIDNANSLIGLNSTAGNLVIGNVDGDLVVADMGAVVVPNGASLSLAASNVNYIYHSGNLPAGGIGEVPNDGKTYGRKFGTWVEISFDTFPAGTKMIFAQVAAPVGWTKDGSDLANNRMLRLVQGNGGGTGGIHSCTLMDKVPAHKHLGTSGNNNASHNHSVDINSGVDSINHTHHYVFTEVVGGNQLQAGPGYAVQKTNIAGSGVSASHKHRVAGSTAYATGVHQHSLNMLDNAGVDAVDWKPKYADCIICIAN